MFDLVHERWISNGVLFSEYARHIELIMESRKRMMYFGDSLEKDGDLAENAGVIFGFFDPDKTQYISNNSDSLFVIRYWGKMANFFLSESTKNQLKQGVEIKEIFFKFE